MITFVCPCRTQLRASDAHAGKQTRCPTCKRVLVIPYPTAKPVAPPPRRAQTPLRPAVWPWLLAATAMLVLVVGGTFGVVSWQRSAKPAPPISPARTEPVAVRTEPEPEPSPPAEVPEEPPARPMPVRQPEAPVRQTQPPPAEAPAATPTGVEGVDRLNAYRAAAGSPPVTLDPVLTRGCQSHAKYIALNLDRISNSGHRADDESPELPGFTEEGRQAARKAFAALYQASAAAPIDNWMGALFLRLVLLDPELQRIGWGQERDPRGRWISILDASRGKGSADIVLYPVDGQTNVSPLYPGTELPDPIPQATQKRAGYPITVTFPRGATVEEVTAQLRESGKEVPCWVSTPEKPAQSSNLQGGTVCLIAKNPLRTGTRYETTVKARVSGSAWERTWSFTTARQERGGGSNGTILERVNGYRKTAGLRPVVLDETLTRACDLHVKYLLRNANHPSTEGLGSHQEDPKLPGYTPEGHRAGQASDISFGVEALASVDAWMATFFHRIPILDPDLERIGFASGKNDKWGPVACLDVQSGRGGTRNATWPPDGRTGVPVAYVPGEQPNPIPQSKDKRAGYPVTVTFPRSALVQKVTAKLFVGEEEVPAWVSTPERTVDEGLQRNTIALIARQPLRPGTTYRARFTADVNNTEWSQEWSFTTGAER